MPDSPEFNRTSTRRSTRALPRGFRAITIVTALFVLLPVVTWAQQGTMAIQDVIAGVLKNDPQSAIAALATSSAYASYRSQFGEALPNVTLSMAPSNGLGYALTTTETPDVNPLTGVATDNIDTKRQSIGAAVNLSQLLPTSGTITANVQNTMVVTVLGTGDSATTEIDQSPKLSVALSQPIFVNGRLIDMRVFPATLRSIRIGYDKARQQEIATRNGALYQAASAFFTIQNLRNQVGYLTSSASALATKLEQLRVSQQQGSVSRSDVTAAEINLEKQRELILEAKYSLSQAESGLARSMGVSDGLAGVPFRADIPTIAITNSLDDMFAKISAQSPQVIQDMLDVESAGLQQTLAGQKYGGSLTASVSVTPNYGYGRENSDKLQDSFSELFNSDHGAYNNVTFSLGVTIPLYQGGKAQQDRTAAEVQKSIAQKSLQQTLSSLRDQLSAAYAKRDYLEQKVAYLVSSVQLQQQRVADQQRLLNLQSATELDVTNATLELTARQNDLYQAKSDLYLANLNIISMTGVDLTQYISQGNAE